MIFFRLFFCSFLTISWFKDIRCWDIVTTITVNSSYCELHLMDGTLVDGSIVTRWTLFGPASARDGSFLFILYSFSFSFPFSSLYMCVWKREMNERKWEKQIMHLVTQSEVLVTIAVSWTWKSDGPMQMNSTDGCEDTLLLTVNWITPLPWLVGTLLCPGHSLFTFLFSSLCPSIFSPCPRGSFFLFNVNSCLSLSLVFFSFVWLIFQSE